MELIIHINDKETKVKDIITDLNNIHKICTNNCAYCEREGITTDKQKIELITKICKKYFEV